MRTFAGMKDIIKKIAEDLGPTYAALYLLYIVGLPVISFVVSLLVSCWLTGYIVSAIR